MCLGGGRFRRVLLLVQLACAVSWLCELLVKWGGFGVCYVFAAAPAEGLSVLVSVRVGGALDELLFLLFCGCVEFV